MTFVDGFPRRGARMNDAMQGRRRGIRAYEGGKGNVYFCDLKAVRRRCEAVRRDDSSPDVRQTRWTTPTSTRRRNGQCVARSDREWNARPHSCRRVDQTGRCAVFLCSVRTFFFFFARPASSRVNPTPHVGEPVRTRNVLLSCVFLVVSLPHFSKKPLEQSARSAARATDLT